MSTMEVRLNWLVKAINDATDATAKEMKKSSQEGFIKVRTKLGSVYVVVSKRAQESVTVQEFASISTGPQARNVQIPPIVINAR